MNKSSYLLFLSACTIYNSFRQTKKRVLLTRYIKIVRLAYYNNKTLQILQMQHFEKNYRKTSKYTYVLDLNKIVIRPRT